MTTKQYIDKYKLTAIREHILRGVPASITLAQGILESASGNSELAIKYNNHFGIKGDSSNSVDLPTYEFEDGKFINIDQPFKVYKNADQSFKDHSLLLDSTRYKDLHNYNDLYNWAYGLKYYGYATDPDYANKLIDIAEKNNLQKFDFIGRNKQVIFITIILIVLTLLFYFIKR